MERITREKIQLLEPAFRIYLDQLLKRSNLQEDIKELVNMADVYLFSGVIRNFFTGNIYEDRDLDVVVAIKNHYTSYHPRLLLRHFEKLKRNSFGGLKIFTKNLDGIEVTDIIW